jgi:hypothetical protein
MGQPSDVAEPEPPSQGRTGGTTRTNESEWTTRSSS